MAPSGERCLTGPCPGLNTGQGPVRGQGRGGKKKKPRPGPLSGVGRGKEPGPRIFRGPGGPVTNSRLGTCQEIGGTGGRGACCGQRETVCWP